MAIRTTVYVPAGLKARMDKARRTNPDLNWSQLACRAFELKLGEIAARKQEKQMEDVVQRLRASALRARAEDAEEGHEEGYQWARHLAEARELMRLANAHEDADGDWRKVFDPDGVPSPPPAAVTFVAIIDAEDSANSRVTEFWENTLGEDPGKAYDDDEYVAAFADGALRLWAEVEDQI